MDQLLFFSKKNSRKALHILAAQGAGRQQKAIPAYSDKNEQLFQIVNFDEKYTDSDNLNTDSDNLNSDSNQNER